VVAGGRTEEQVQEAARLEFVLSSQQMALLEGIEQP
jgi:hypothetical protein